MKRPLRVAVPVEQLLPLYPFSELKFDEVTGWSLHLGSGTQKLLCVDLEYSEDGQTLTMEEDQWPHVVTPT